MTSWLAPIVAVLLACSSVQAQTLVVTGKTVHTMSGPDITDGVVVIEDGEIIRVGASSSIAIPQGAKVLSAAVVTPGLIDAHAVVGLTGYLNQDQDQDQLDLSDAIQPELRAIDSYNPQERLIEWLRGFGITTIHTGHAPGALISGQTMIAKTIGNTVDDALVKPTAMVAARLGVDSRDNAKPPGTRSKAVAMLRSEFLKAQNYQKKMSSDDEKKRPDRDLRMETLGRILSGELPLLVTANRTTDMLAAIRVAKEFGIKIVLDGAAEAYLIIDEIKAAGVPVIIHPTMARSGRGETENISFETASRLHAAGIPVALQSGYESYVPKTRVVLFEAGIAAANGMSQSDALALITIDAARILGIADRVGSLEPGKDADLALFDGDPFEYTSHCIDVVINGKIVSEEAR